MIKCKNCAKEFSTNFKLNGISHNLGNRKFCLDCSPFKQHNTRDITTIKLSAKSSYANVKTFRHRKKDKAIEYKGGKCCVCGYQKCRRNLSFHHLDPSQKDFAISSKTSWGFDKIKAELDKCILVCHNCHGEIHAGLVVMEGIEPSA